ncbi:MAG: hypothetical protein JWR75_623 [Devosia sp.]|nr:hypothetical protein [Devosia sp.]
MPKLTDADKVIAYMAAFTSPLLPAVEALRAAIKSAGPALAERIKWNAPSYHLDGLDMAAMNFHDPAAIRLVMVYPKGLPAASHGLLEGSYPDRRLAYFRSLAEVRSNRDAIVAIVGDWLALARA